VSFYLEGAAMTERNIAKKAVEEIKRSNEHGARQALLEDLFYDFNRSRADIYKMNFVRGIFFGLGSVIGGTVIFAVILWLMSFFIDIPGIGHSVQQLQQTLQESKNK
jgi:hypothetical protein